jgi:hypothetical protein
MLTAIAAAGMGVSLHHAAAHAHYAAASMFMRLLPSSFSIVKPTATCGQQVEEEGQLGNQGHDRHTHTLQQQPDASCSTKPYSIPASPPTNRQSQEDQRALTSLMCEPFMICSTVTSRVKGRSGSSLGVSRKHWGVPSLRARRAWQGSGTSI